MTNEIEWLGNAIQLREFLQGYQTGTKVRRTTEPRESNNQLQRSVYVRFFIFIFPSYQSGFLSMLKVSMFSL